MLKQIKDDPPPPLGPNGPLEKSLEAAILKCLRKDPAERFASVDDLRRALEDLSA